MITPNPEVAELTRRARESWQSLRRGESWEHWLTIGRAIDAFRRQLFHDLKINEPKGQAYKEAMGAYLAENGWQQPTKEDPNGIDNTARVNLQKIVDRLPEFEAWRATLPLGNQLKQNHPNTVWRAFCKAFPEPGDSDNGEKRKTETQRLRQERDEAIDEIARLQAEVETLQGDNETLTARAETATAEAGFMWDSTPEQVAEKMVKANAEKAIDLTVYLLAEISRAGLGERLIAAGKVVDVINESVEAGILSVAPPPAGETVSPAPPAIITAGDTPPATPKRKRLGRKTVRVRPGETIPKSIARAERERAEKAAAKGEGEAIPKGEAAYTEEHKQALLALRAELIEIGPYLLWDGEPITNPPKVGDITISKTAAFWRAHEYRASGTKGKWTLIPESRAVEFDTMMNAVRFTAKAKGEATAPAIITAGPFHGMPVEGEAFPEEGKSKIQMIPPAPKLTDEQELIALRTELSRRYDSWLTWTPRHPETAKLGDIWIKGYENPDAGRFMGFEYREDRQGVDWRTIDNQWSDLRTTLETVRRHKAAENAKGEGSAEGNRHAGVARHSGFPAACRGIGATLGTELENDEHNSPAALALRT